MDATKMERRSPGPVTVEFICVVFYLSGGKLWSELLDFNTAGGFARQKLLPAFSNNMLLLTSSFAVQVIVASMQKTFKSKCTNKRNKINEHQTY